MSPLTTNPQIEFLDQEELAKKLNVNPRWVKEHAKRSAKDPIPRVKFGKYVRFPWGSEEMKEWLGRRRVKR